MCSGHSLDASYFGPNFFRLVLVHKKVWCYLFSLSIQTGVFVVTFCIILLCRTYMHNFLAFLVGRGNIKSIICKVAIKCTFYVSKKVWIWKNSKDFENEYGKCAQH